MTTTLAASTPWRTTPCGSCGRPMIWCVTPNKKRQPIDAEPSVDGTILLRPSLADPKTPLAVVCDRDEILRQLRDDETTVFRKAHHQTCPDGPAWRRK